MNFEEVASESSDGSNLQFWRAIGIWLRNPHVVNRRILGFHELLVARVCRDIPDILEHVEKLRVKPEDFEGDSSAADAKHFSDILGLAEYCQLVQRADPVEAADDVGTYLRVRKLLPRNTQIFSSTLEFLFVDRGSTSVTSFHKPIVPREQSLGPNTAYRIRHREYVSTCIDVRETDGGSRGGRDWLRSKFLPRLTRWMDTEHGAVDQRISSLSLVSVERYTQLYNRLKGKYGAGMVSAWPENTDPAKFVYEDVAIATYLLLLWEKERLETGAQEPQSFVDLGCGNGLLVHILSSEGHRGTGIDLRRRKIWDLFPEGTRLQVGTIVPSSDTVFPGVDWVIGNHSDELTPWIPVIAARSSYECRFFLLPCCAYEFDGSKYRRRIASESQYSDYMSYVRGVCEGCGFLTLTDRLRIPSTKRICFVGWKRTYARENIAALDAEIQRIINARSQVDSAKTGTENGEPWSASFKPRDSTERTRNCTQLDKGLVLEIVNAVAAHLLRAGRRIPLERRPGATWNAGGQIDVGEAAKLIAPWLLLRLRNECGGLQTLLKNHSHIFNVGQGKVQFRIPGTVDKQKRRRRNASAPLRKVKPCWFHENHPDGCPALEVDCNFQH
ncbi:PREDICTED: probable tRNA (uracil-O(2)-)-methyltransferase [Vollenhovia emeryi]|uniref:probable tRNA (uracil-O(2)-)-methyltransferase n=1 Tax=Vollenhovia emeryi TaxID=411798 RepID=UPI0005F53F91|nr:PREDICTED: probable tRNA (uracil-O(2)-)-methyltransferase [Vollenhovia emeryi]